MDVEPLIETRYLIILNRTNLNNIHPIIFILILQLYRVKLRVGVSYRFSEVNESL